ncbi:MAG: hypothetical protein GY910_17780 [bacterium]|nr:hypothetical protein [bacterium]
MPNDARYVTRATVFASSRETFALKLDPLWERVQQRAFVRISAQGLQVRVVRLATRPSADNEPSAESDDDCLQQLLDVSAGGIRFESDGDWDPDEDVICHFELPSSPCFELPAWITRSMEDLPERSTKPSVAFEFVGLGEDHRSQLLRWVYREQVRRRRAKARISTSDLSIRTGHDSTTKSHRIRWTPIHHPRKSLEYASQHGRLDRSIDQRIRIEPLTDQDLAPRFDITPHDLAVELGMELDTPLTRTELKDRVLFDRRRPDDSRITRGNEHRFDM